MKQQITSVILLIFSILVANADQRMLHIYKNGTLVNTYNIESIDYMEIVDMPDQPEVKKRIISGGENGYVTYFTYTDDKITSTNGYSEVRYLYDLENSKIVQSGGYNFYLNDGLISKYEKKPYTGERTDYDKNLEYTYVSQSTYEFKYDNRRLISITEIETEVRTYEDNHTETSSKIDNYIEFTWKNDVIVNQKEGYFSNNKLKLTRDYYYEYDDRHWIGTETCAFFQSNSVLFDDWPEALIVQGYFGEMPKYLVTKATDVLPNGFGINTFEYTFDSDGYPIHMTWYLKDGRGFGYYYRWETIEP